MVSFRYENIPPVAQRLEKSDIIVDSSKTGLLPCDKRKSCDGSFSAEWRIKCWTRTSMGRDRLSQSSIYRIKRYIALDTEVIFNNYFEGHQTFPLQF